MPTLTTVYGSAASAPVGYAPLFLVSIIFDDGGILRLSTNPLSILEGGLTFGVQYSGFDWLARLDQQELASIQAVNALGITLIPSVNFTIADPDASIYLAWHMAAGRGFKGATVTVDLDRKSVV